MLNEQLSNKPNDVENFIDPYFPLGTEAAHGSGVFSTVVESSCHDYKELDSQNGQIRLIEILPANGGDKIIRCRTSICDLSSKPTFVALSYTWGSPPAQHAIELDGKVFWIRKNLWRFLMHIRKIEKFAVERFWIDAICINQTNINERNQQVNLMPQVYQGAYKVLIWLGPAYDNSDEAIAHLSNPLSTSGNKSAMLKIWSKVSGKAISELCWRPYWSRLWVFQEILLAQQIDLMCGDKILEWKCFQEFLSSVHYAAPGSRSRERLAFKNTASSAATTIVLQIIRDVGERSLLSLINATRELRCSETRDKVYGLLGVAVSGHDSIAADYELPLQVLLNHVLQEHYTERAPTSLEQALGQIQDLSNSFGTDLHIILGLHPNYQGRFPIPSDSDVALFAELLDETKVDILLWATYYDQKAVLRLMFDDYIEPSTIRDLLLKSAEDGRENVVRILLNIYSDVSKLEHGDKVKAFRSAVAKHHCLIVEMLICMGHVDAETQLEYEYTALDYAIGNRNAKMAAVLVNSGALDLNRKRGRTMTTRIHSAAAEGCAPIMKLLLDTGKVDINSKDRWNRTVLHQAGFHGDSEVISLLLLADELDVNARDKYGQTGFHEAVIHAEAEAIEPFLNTIRVDINAQEEKGYTALHMAAMLGHVAKVMLMINTGRIDVNIENSEGKTALQEAVKEGHKEVIAILSV